MMNNKVLILHNKINNSCATDEVDVLNQVNWVYNALNTIGYKTEILALTENIIDEINKIKKIKPLFVFNLVESVFNKNQLLYFAPAMLSAFNIPYTGVNAEGIFITTNKILTKNILSLNKIPTPSYFTLNQINLLSNKKKYILKPINEDGSVGLDEDSVFSIKQTNYLKKISSLSKTNYFIEEFIEGREFNVSLLGNDDNIKVLEPAEIIFKDFPEGKEKVLGYKAKWDENSFEYKNTIRLFDTLQTDSNLYLEIKKISMQCCKIFSLNGFARVDFRVDENDNIYVIEINANPCISPDSGFIAAAYKSGLSDAQIIEKLIEKLIC